LHKSEIWFSQTSETAEKLTLLTFGCPSYNGKLFQALI